MKRKYEIAVISKGSFARTVRIYSPKKADRAIIMHDGQNVFRDEEATFKKSWRALDVLKDSGIKNTAIIGIDSVDATRFDDYLPFAADLSEYGMPKGGGKAHIYADYIEQIILPYLDKRFGYKHYGMLGSSAGATATLCVAERKNSKFKAYGFFSTPLFLCSNDYDELLSTATFDTAASYYVYTGGSEAVGDLPDEKIKSAVTQLFVNSAVTLTNAFRKAGVKKLRLEIDNQSVHDEICWRAPEKKFFEAFAKI